MRAIGVVIPRIPAPLQDVPMHVVQTPGVRWLLSHRMRLVSAVPSHHPALDKHPPRHPGSSPSPSPPDMRTPTPPPSAAGVAIPAAHHPIAPGPAIARSTPPRPTTHLLHRAVRALEVERDPGCCPGATVLRGSTTRANSSRYSRLAHTFHHRSPLRLRHGGRPSQNPWEICTRCRGSSSRPAPSPPSRKHPGGFQQKSKAMPRNSAAADSHSLLIESAAVCSGLRPRSPRRSRPHRPHAATTNRGQDRPGTHRTRTGHPALPRTDPTPAHPHRANPRCPRAPRRVSAGPGIHGSKAGKPPLS